MFRFRYSTPAEEVFNVASSNDPSKDFALQMSKLAHGLLSGEYSKTPDTPAPVADDQPVVIVRLGLKICVALC